MGNYRSKVSDPRGGHVRLYWDILDSAAWRALSSSARCLYVEMRRNLLKTNNGDIAATINGMQTSGFTSKATLSKALRELMAVGLIAKTRQGGIARSSKECSLYRFTDIETFELPKKGVERQLATNEWRSFRTLSDAKSAIEAAHKSVKKVPVENEPCVQKLNLTSAETELAALKTGAEIEHQGIPLVQKLNPSKKVEYAAKLSAALLSAEIYACH